MGFVSPILAFGIYSDANIRGNLKYKTIGLFLEKYKVKSTVVPTKIDYMVIKFKKKISLNLIQKLI